MKLGDLPNWPPNPGGLNPSGKYKVPMPDQAVLKSVEPRRLSNRIVFTGEFEGNSHTYDYEAKHEKLAEHIETHLLQHIGKGVMYLGDIEIDEDAVN